jgi:hypothetical protein
MKEKEINKSYSTIQPNSFYFAKSRNLKHIKVSEMKFVKGKFVKETACGRNLVEPVDFPNQIKETNKNLYVRNHLYQHCLKCLVAIDVLEFAGREKVPMQYEEGYEIDDRYWFLKTVIVGSGKEQQTFKQGDKW